MDLSVRSSEIVSRVACEACPAVQSFRRRPRRLRPKQETAPRKRGGPTERKEIAVNIDCSNSPPP